MDLVSCLHQQLRAHPAMQPQDVIKLCYQAACGAEHLLADLNRARRYFDQEYAATPADAAQPIFEPLSPEIARANIAAWKAAGLPADWLFRMFAGSAGVRPDARERLTDMISQADALLRTEAPFPLSGWEGALTRWRDAGCPAVHHSDAYRTAERPAYRIVDGRYACILPLLRTLSKRTDVRTLAIDGRAASGKTTKAALLAQTLDAPVIHMDDFFLPPDLRTAQRLAQPGGNVHHERFCQEVLPALRRGDAFAYRMFDCGRMDYAGAREIPAAPLRIVEGSYALHPALGDYADLTVFSDVDAQEQMRRILRRNGEGMAETFRTRWIPMEEAYFEHFGIRQRADMQL